MKIRIWFKEMTTPRIIPLTPFFYVSIVWRMNAIVLLGLAYGIWQHSWFLSVLSIACFALYGIFMPLMILRRLNKPLQSRPTIVS